MNVQELFKSVSWDKVAASLVATYPEEGQSLEGYKKVFYEVCAIVPEVNDDDTAVVLHDAYDIDDNPYIDVSGKKPDSDQFWALEFCSFGKWAGFLVDAGTLERFCHEEIAARILYEMTFMGFDDETIQTLRQELINTVNEYRKELTE